MTAVAVEAARPLVWRLVQCHEDGSVTYEAEAFFDGGRVQTVGMTVDADGTVHHEALAVGSCHECQAYMHSVMRGLVPGDDGYRSGGCGRRHCAFRDHPTPHGQPLSKPPKGAHWYVPRGAQLQLFAGNGHSPGPVSECEFCSWDRCSRCGQRPDVHELVDGGLFCVGPAVVGGDVPEEAGSVEPLRVAPSPAVGAVLEETVEIERGPVPVPAEGMQPVLMVTGPGDGTDLSEIESPRWGPGWLS